MRPKSGHSYLRISGMGSAYGFGGIGKILGPVGLAPIVVSNNYLKPDVPLTQIPLAFVYLGCWFLMAGIVYYFFGIGTRGKSIKEIDRELDSATQVAAVAQVRQIGIDGSCWLRLLLNWPAIEMWSHEPKPSSQRLRPPPTKSNRDGDYRPPCSINCTRRNYSAFCCRNPPTASRPIPSP